MKKRLLSLFLVLCMICTLFPLSAFAAGKTDSGTCGDNLTWKLDYDGTLTISGTGDMTSTPWENYSHYIDSVVIGYGVTSIGDYAFVHCLNLSSVVIPDSVTSIGTYAFFNCYNLGTIVIPDSVTSISEQAFVSCVAKIDVSSNNKNYASLDGVLFSKDMKTIMHCYGFKSGTYTIPDGVTSIGNGAFIYCYNLTDIVIPNSVTSIGNSAFNHCESLTDIVIPDSVTSIGGDAFFYCSNLESIVLPSRLTSIEYGVFYGCSKLKSVTIPGSVTVIGDNAFNMCDNLDSVYFGGSEAKWNNISIGDGNSALDSATMHFGEDPLEGSCGDDAFWTYDGDTQTLTISGRGELYNYRRGCAPWAACDIQTIKISEGITYLGEYCFSDLEHLIYVYIPSTVKRINTDCFKNSCATSASNPDLMYNTIVYYYGKTGVFNEAISYSVFPESFSIVFEDHFSYLNCADTNVSYQGFNKEDGYYMTDLDKKLLFDNATLLQRRDINDELKNEWGGCCYGMSDVYLKYHSGGTDLSFYQYGATNLNSLTVPKDNKDMLSAITANSFCQYICKVTKGPSTSTTLMLLMEYMTSTGNGCILELRGEGIFNRPGHAVVAESIEERDGKWIIHIYDPDYHNSAKGTSALEITHDGSKFRGTMYHYYRGLAGTAPEVEENYEVTGFYKYEHLKDIESLWYSRNTSKKLLKTLSSNALKNSVEERGFAETAESIDVIYKLITNAPCFTISQGSKNAVIENYKVKQGDYEILDGYSMGDGITSCFDIYAVRNDSEPIVITFPDEGLDVYNATITCCEGDIDGFGASVSMQSAGSIIFKSSGSVETKCDNENSQEILTVRNDCCSERPFVTVSADAADLSVSQTTDAVNINSSSDTVNVIAEDAYFDVTESVSDIDMNEGGIEITADGAVIDVESGMNISDLHDYTAEITVPATCIDEGTVVYTCSCGKTYSESIPAKGHSFTNYVSDGNATCTADGTKTAKCDNCDVTDTVTDVGSKLPHTYGAPVFTWSGYNCAAAIVCSCGDTQSVECTVTSAVTKEATTKNEGVRTYTATVVIDGQTYTSTATESIPKLDDGGSTNIFTTIINAIKSVVDNIINSILSIFKFK